MKGSRIVWMIAVAGLGLAAIAGWWPSDERRIHKLLTRLADEASVPARGGALADLSAANRIADAFAPAFEISLNVPGAPEVSISHRSELVQAVMTARSRQQGATIALLDPQTIKLAPASAVVEATVRAQAAGESEPFVAEVRFTLVKLDARWCVSRVETIRSFE